jgi:integrase
MAADVPEARPAEQPGAGRRQERRQPDLSIPDANTVGRIMAEVEPEYRLPLTIAAMTGLRRSEVAALRWSGVELDGDYPKLRVDGGMHRRPEGLTRTQTKSARSNRDVPLPTSLVGLLRTHRREQTERRLALGAAWQDHDLVIERGDGGAFDPNLLTKAFHRACQRVGVEGVRLHDLRHAWATMQVAAGVDVTTISRALGHSTVSFTLDVYTHPDDAAASKLAVQAEAAYGGSLG